MDYQKISITSGLIILVSYVLASACNGAIVSFVLLKGSPANKKRGSVASTKIESRLTAANLNGHVAAILARNVFDSENKLLPEDQLKEEPKAIEPVKKDGPCPKSSAPIKLLGTILSKYREASMAFIVEKGFQDADVYYEEESLFDEGKITIVQIKRNMVVFDNKGTRECIVADEEAKKFAQKHISTRVKGEAEIVEEYGDVIMMDPAFVDDQLGPGFANILNKQRLVPSMDNAGKPNGFKIFSILSGSLFSRVGLKDGDVITNVNDHDLRDPSQGFKIFESIKEGKDVAITFERNGKKLQRFIKIK